MYLTKYQRSLVDSKSLVKVSYAPIYEKEGTIGYTFKDKFYYKIRMDESIKDNEKVNMSILIHELAHIELGHMDESITEAVKEVFRVAESLGISKESVRAFNRGPIGVINVCMDLEVNDKFLTRENIRDLRSNNHPPVTLDRLKLEPKDTWRDYIEPYLKLMKDKYDEVDKILKEVFESMKDIGEMQTKRMKGKGNKGNNPDEDNNSKSPGQTADDSEGNNSEDKDKEGKSSNKSEGDGEDQKDKNDQGQGNDGDVTDEDLEDDGNEAPDYFDEEEDELGDMLTTSNDKHDDSTSYGLSHSKSHESARANTKSPSKILEDFLMQILNHEKIMTPDSMKHYNRGTRRNDSGLIYTSISRKTRLRPKKLGILIDVSGSMDSDSLLTALSSLEPLLHMLHKDSKVVAWDTDLCGEYSLDNLPKSLRSRGGTDMAEGLRYLTKNGFDTVVIYSDFDTNTYSLHDAAVEFGKDLSFIHVVQNGWGSRVNTNNIIKDQKSLVKRAIKLEI